MSLWKLPTGTVFLWAVASPNNRNLANGISDVSHTGLLPVADGDSGAAGRAEGSVRLHGHHHAALSPARSDTLTTIRLRPLHMYRNSHLNFSERQALYMICFHHIWVQL